jgi:hypothetical protein
MNKKDRKKAESAKWSGREFRLHSIGRSAVKLTLKTSLAFLVSLAVVCVPLLAHHGTGVAYEVDKTVTLKGTVTEWIWANPHCGILFDVTDAAGQVTHWGAELSNPHQLSLAGFSKDTLKPGDKITLTGNPAKSGAPRINLLNGGLILPDGRALPEKQVKGNGEAVPSEK